MAEQLGHPRVLQNNREVLVEEEFEIPVVRADREDATPQVVRGKDSVLGQIFYFISHTINHGRIGHI